MRLRPKLLRRGGSCGCVLSELRARKRTEQEQIIKPKRSIGLEPIELWQTSPVYWTWLPICCQLLFILSDRGHAFFRNRDPHIPQNTAAIDYGYYTDWRVSDP